MHGAGSGDSRTAVIHAMNGASLGGAKSSSPVEALVCSSAVAGGGIGPMSNGGPCNKAGLSNLRSVSATNGTATPEANGSPSQGTGLASDSISLDPESTPTRFYIPAAEVRQMLQQHGIDEDALLRALIRPASRLARPYISKFNVGAVGLGESGSIYFGVNLEFPGVPLNSSIHAEQCLIANAVQHGEGGLRKLAISEAPCGHCRQFYSELCCSDTIQISFGSPLRSYSLAEILPQRFGPADLLEDADVPLLLQPQSHQLELRAAQGGEAAGELRCRATQAALDAARTSYCPYTLCASGVAIITASGQLFSGGYLESAAYNPSLPPFQAAVVSAVTGGMPAYDQISEVVLVEGVPGEAPVQHAATLRLLLDAVAPAASLTVLHWRRP